MSKILDKVRDEPAVAVGLVQAVLALFLAFGVPLTDEQVGAILAVSAAVLALVVRRRVVPAHLT
jgi:hypothetical protein